MATATHDKRTVLVTGGSRGIGRATALRLADDGMAIAVGYQSREADARAVAEEITDRGGAAIALRVDVADADSVGEAFDAVEAEWGGVDVVVNSAGTTTLGPVAALDLTELDRVLATNVRGAFAVSQQAGRRMRNGGAIIHLSSSAVKMSPPAYGAYVSSKAAVEALIPTLAKELRGRDITVNAIAPGPTETDMFRATNNDESIGLMTSLTPMGRIGQTDDLMGAMSLLAGEGRWINGQVIQLNGGLA